MASLFKYIVVEQELEMSSQDFFLINENSFCYSWFRLQSMAIHCNRRGCRQEHLTRVFSHALRTSDCVHTHCMAQDEPMLNVS